MSDQPLLLRYPTMSGRIVTLPFPEHLWYKSRYRLKLGCDEGRCNGSLCRGSRDVRQHLSFRLLPYRTPPVDDSVNDGGRPPKKGCNWLRVPHIELIGKLIGRAVTDESSGLVDRERGVHSSREGP